MAKEVTRDEQLAWEERWAKPAAASAIGAVVLTLRRRCSCNTLFKAPAGAARDPRCASSRRRAASWLARANVVQALSLCWR